MPESHFTEFLLQELKQRIGSPQAEETVPSLLQMILEVRESARAAGSNEELARIKKSLQALGIEVREEIRISVDFKSSSK